VSKKYFVKTDGPISDEMVLALENGIMIGYEEKTLPAVIEDKNQDQCTITITEGKYHQIKRMFHAVGRNVIYLKRLSMGTLVLDQRLLEGQIRELTKEEVDALCLRT
jgi:16S rRNA pseudouridine516 synthase